jgi:hypothetical protein
LHILSHIRLTLITSVLPWKRNRLLFGRPFMVTEYRTTMKFRLIGKAAYAKLIFRIWTLIARTTIFLIPLAKFYLEIRSQQTRANLIEIVQPY